MLKTNRFLFFIFFLWFLSSCTGYQKLLKSTNTKLKYEKALEFFQNKDYARSLSLFESIMPMVRGTDMAETCNYYRAKCHYNMEDYILAGYHFRNFASEFPNSNYVEEVEFLSAYCFYLDSPRYSLDQTNTYDAIDAFQLFITRFPVSDKIPECNKYIQILRSKLEKKSYMNARLYFDLGHYKAGWISLKNTLRDFPDTDYREEILYLIFKSNYLYAKNSVVSKQQERYEAAIKEYHNLLNEFPETVYQKQVKKMYDKSENAIRELKSRKG